MDDKAVTNGESLQALLEVIVETRPKITELRRDKVDEFKAEVMEVADAVMGMAGPPQKLEGEMVGTRDQIIEVVAMYQAALMFEDFMQSMNKGTKIILQLASLKIMVKNGNKGGGQAGNVQPAGSGDDASGRRESAESGVSGQAETAHH